MEAALQGMLHSSSVMSKVLASEAQDTFSRHVCYQSSCNSFQRGKPFSRLHLGSDHLMC